MDGVGETESAKGFSSMASLFHFKWTLPCLARLIDMSTPSNKQYNAACTSNHPYKLNSL